MLQGPEALPEAHWNEESYCACSDDIFDADRKATTVSILTQTSQRVA